jgi:hypothetical protein
MGSDLPEPRVPAGHRLPSSPRQDSAAFLQVIGLRDAAEAGRRARVPARSSSRPVVERS